MKVLSVASEIFPLVKTGGLADVAGALPKALAEENVEVRTLVPGYPAVLGAIGDAEPVGQYADLFGAPARLLGARASGLDLLVIDAPHLFARPGNPYTGPDGRDWPDNGRRFAALASTAVQIARGAISDFAPDILHCHDWQAGLAPAYVKFGKPVPVKSVATIHNIAFQGQFGADLFPELGLPPDAFAIDGVEYFGGVGYLKAALQCADAITTVSPTYADEICGEQFGMGLQGLLQSRRGDLHGILNGIDVDVWDPATDAALACRFDPTSIEQRTINKWQIEQRLGLAIEDGPLYCVVSRLTWQKGMDLLIGAIEGLVQGGARLVVLGSGERDLEQAFRQAAERHAGRIGTVIGYDEAFSHLLLGGADAILIPSRFEPCGLTQLQGLRYGCVPVVARIGGLADTVIDANEAGVAAGTATGVQFSPIDGISLEYAIRRTNRLFAERDTWRRLQANGMTSDVSWRRSAKRYAALYRALLARSPARGQS